MDTRIAKRGEGFSWCSFSLHGSLSSLSFNLRIFKFSWAQCSGVILPISGHLIKRKGHNVLLRPVHFESGVDEPDRSPLFRSVQFSRNKYCEVPRTKNPPSPLFFSPFSINVGTRGDFCSKTYIRLSRRFLTYLVTSQFYLPVLLVEENFYFTNPHYLFVPFHRKFIPLSVPFTRYREKYEQKTCPTSFLWIREPFMYKL